MGQRWCHFSCCYCIFEWSPTNGKILLFFILEFLEPCVDCGFDICAYTFSFLMVFTFLLFHHSAISFLTPRMFIIFKSCEQMLRKEFQYCRAFGNNAAKFWFRKFFNENAKRRNNMLKFAQVYPVNKVQAKG